MRVPKRAGQITRPAYKLLAALMLADGEWVPRRDLADLLFDWPVSAVALSARAWAVERYGGLWIERRYRLGYRLATLPSDEHLEPMLACVPDVKRSRWWAQWSRVEMTA